MKRKHFLSRFIWLLCFVVCAACAPPSPSESEARKSSELTAATFVQVNSAVPQTAMASVSVPYASTQTAGNTNVVIVGWNDTTASVTSVTDSAGNAYTLAIGPTAATSQLTQSIYYATNIKAAAAGSNTVTAHFNQNAQFVDLRILEYSGIDTTNPVDAKAGASGTAATADSGALVTTNANDLIVGANTVTTGSLTPGAGFTSRVVTNPDDDLVEDEGVTAAGSYHATAPVINGGTWVMQAVAFRVASSTSQPPPAPVLSGVAAGSISATGATITWTSNTPTTSVVDYGPTTSYGSSSALDTTLKTSHQVALSGLSPSTTYHVRARGSDATNVQATSADITFTTTAAADTTPPTVSITSPIAGATLSATANITATASDNGTVAGVTFFADGAAIGAEQTSAPFAIAWNTTGVANGSHTLTARARDAASNVATSAAVTVTVSNTATAAAATWIQTNSATPQSTLATVAVPFTKAQGAGDTNIVAVGWNDTTATVTSVTDSAGNTYQRAVGPTLLAGSMSQSIYYASNIVAAAAGANTVTVRFNGSAAFPDIRILEYAGLATSGALDVAVGASGNGSTSDSGAGTTTNANDLLFGANMVTGGTTGAGTGFTSRIITDPDSDIAEDRAVTAIGTYHATAPTTNCGWIMQLVAFKATGSAPPPPDNTPPTISITAPAGGSTITGSTTLSANAHDDVGVTNVTFLVDGVSVGQVTSAPFSLSWASTTVVNGTHTLTATASDAQHNTTTSAPVTITVQNSVAQGPVQFPLVVSPDGRFLMGTNGVPFLVAGDSPQCLSANLSTANMDAYFAARAAQGFNTVWVNLLCTVYTGGRTDASTYDGVEPFLGTISGGFYDVTAPNPTYFARIDAMLAAAAARGIVVFLDPIETGGFGPTIAATSQANMRAYGRFLGQRYLHQSNIVWMSGNDLAGFNPIDNVIAVQLGIQDAGAPQLQTAELDWPAFASTLENPNFTPSNAPTNINLCYTYNPQYALLLREYDRPPHLPNIFIEGDYEGENISGIGGTHTTNAHDTRAEAYWTNLSGGAGQFYGNHWEVFGMDNATWQTKLAADQGAPQMLYLKQLFEARKWWSLVPDETHTVVTSGFGTCMASSAAQGNGSPSEQDNTCATTARTADGTLVMTYVPNARAITVAMSKLAGSATARWYDPTTGVYTTIAGSPLPNSGSPSLTPPAGTHTDGHSDWVLVLETSPPN